MKMKKQLLALLLAASASISGSRSIKRAKYGFTASTRVCCSMISDTQTRYGVGSSRQGKLRLLLSYHVNSPGAIRFNSSCFLCTSIFLGVCCFNPVLRFFLFCSPQAIALITLQCHQAAFQRVVLLLQAALRKLQIQGSSNGIQHMKIDFALQRCKYFQLFFVAVRI